MLLLITGSRDGTSDFLCKELGTKVFRLNYDIFNDYTFEFFPNSWRITSPSGNKISSESITSCFWWKAFNFPIENQDNYVVEEIKYIYRELYAWCKLLGLVKGNASDYHHHMGKINLLDIASKYFKTPKSIASIQCAGVASINGPVVAKSLSSALTNSMGSLLTTEVDTSKLDPAFPWFLQEKIDSAFDVTIFVCNQKIFSFQRSRANLKGLDWRGEQNFDPNSKEWKFFPLTKEQVTSIKSFCNEISVDWGRLDFMKSSNELVFLEFNANGQWLFLDYDGEHGLLQSVISYLLPTNKKY